jgi:hypothetical protein
MIRHASPPNDPFLKGKSAAPTALISAAKVAPRALKIKR